MIYNNNEQACSINIYIAFSCFNNREKPLTTVVASSMLNNIVETIVNNIIRSTNNAVVNNLCCF